MQARLCITLTTIVPGAFKYDDRRYYWYNVEDEEKVRKAIMALGKERVFGRKRRLGKNARTVQSFEF